MAYETGQVGSNSALRDAMMLFAEANGWRIQGDSLSKGVNHVSLTLADPDQVVIAGANSADFSVDPCPQKARIWLPSSAWPVTYHLFAHESPDLLLCVVNYTVSRHQWMACGDIQKYGAWEGGNWFAASHCMAAKSTNGFYFTPTQAGEGQYRAGYWRSPAAPFWNTRNTDSHSNGFQHYRASFLHCRVDGNIWPGANANNTVWPSFPQYAHPIQMRQPNSWSQQSVMTPMWLWLPRSDGYISLLGHLEHWRSLRLNYYNAGDILTLGGERWKVFPWWEKDIQSPNGSYGSSAGSRLSTGTFGFAVRYDGP
ncbi:hypothetical protein [Hahella sp. HN01]|uniref:hypothetical protein n=1 Tax=Hahella sp. HN01 TaxID=2847262 RepID=UPI001C1F04E1|nr:hypothetical protein [Hahella sp. HN01]MBU6956082.1 hypothetical protein [Hahella sp. HN01]